MPIKIKTSVLSRIVALPLGHIGFFVSLAGRRLNLAQALEYFQTPGLATILANNRCLRYLFFGGKSVIAKGAPAAKN
jgi:hypothetical protein